MSQDPDHDGYATELAYAYDLSLPQGRQLAELALNALDPTYAPGAALHLADPAVAEAYLSSPLGPYATEESVERTEGVARRAIAAGMDTAGAWLARARVAEHRGDLAVQRAHLSACLERDPGFGPALLDLGHLAFVEGDIARARRMLAASADPRAGHMLHVLTHFGPRPPSAGRNERCPCGSGTKHKYCCAGDAPYPIAARALWLWDKAGTWLWRLPQSGALMDLAIRLSGRPSGEADGRGFDGGGCDGFGDLEGFDGDAFHDLDDLEGYGACDGFGDLEGHGGDLEDAWDAAAAAHDEQQAAAAAVLAQPVVESVALLEGGLMARFLERLGGLLPADERELAERWTSVRHRAWRVEATTPGESLLLSDLGGGETLEAVNGAVSVCTQPGELVFAAVVPTGAGWLLPCHPIGLTPLTARTLVALAGTVSDPVALAAVAFVGAIDAPL